MHRPELFRLIAAKMSLYAFDSLGLCTLAGEFEAQSLATVIASQHEARLGLVVQHHDSAAGARYSILQPSEPFRQIFGAPEHEPFYLLERDKLGTSGCWISHSLLLHYKDLWAEPLALCDDDFLDEA